MTPTDKARQAVQELERRIGEAQAALAALDKTEAGLRRELGVAQADGNAGAVRKAQTELGNVGAERQAVTEALSVLDGRLQDARNAQRQAVADALQALADAQERENAKASDALRALFDQVRELTGGIPMLNPGSRYEHDQHKPERLRGAAAMVASGQSAPIDPVTGRAFDSGLW